MKTISIATLASIFFLSCSKSDIDTTTPPPPPAGVIVKQITEVVFENNNSSGTPTLFYITNSNTGETIKILNENSQGIYSARFSGLNGHLLTGMPRASTTNVCGFDAGVGDTIIISKNGIEEIKAVFINDNLNIVNGGVFVTRFGNETNVAAGQRINNHVINTFPLQKFKPI